MKHNDDLCFNVRIERLDTNGKILEVFEMQEDFNWARQFKPDSTAIFRHLTNTIRKRMVASVLSKGVHHSLGEGT